MERIETINGKKINLCEGCKNNNLCDMGMDNCMYSDEYRDED